MYNIVACRAAGGSPILPRGERITDVCLFVCVCVCGADGWKVCVGGVLGNRYSLLSPILILTQEPGTPWSPLAPYSGVTVPCGAVPSRLPQTTSTDYILNKAGVRFFIFQFGISARGNRVLIKRYERER